MSNSPVRASLLSLLAIVALALTVTTANAAVRPEAVSSAQSATYRHFSSPSGNIGCVVWRHFARCDIAQHSYPKPPKPRQCFGDYDGGSIVIRRVPHFECITDTALGGKVLHYGKSVRLGKFRCTSRRNGMHCENLGTGHGFRLSRASYTIF
jgi:Family of unknown function (DUF6636)